MILSLLCKNEEETDELFYIQLIEQKEKNRRQVYNQNIQKMADGTYKCHDCHMTFGTLNLLQKHKQKFCVGGSVGDPDSLRLRKGLRSDDDPIARPYSPEEKVSTLYCRLSLSNIPCDVIYCTLTFIYV